LVELMRELEAYPVAVSKAVGDHDPAGVVVPLRLKVEGGTLEFVSTTTIFGTPLDITLAELAIESFFTANAATAEALRRLV
jgi:hypothetical protein